MKNKKLTLNEEISQMKRMMGKLMNEFFFDGSSSGESEPIKKPTISNRNPKKMASFDDKEWYDENDYQANPSDFGDDYDEETFDDWDTMNAKHPEYFQEPNQKGFDNFHGGKELFNTYRERHGNKPFKVRTRRNMD